MKFIYMKKSGQVRKVDADNKKAINELKGEGFNEIALDGKGKVTVKSEANTEIEALKAEIVSLKAELKAKGK